MAENDASFGSKLTTDTPDFDSVINNLPMNKRSAAGSDPDDSVALAASPTTTALLPVSGEDFAAV